jgi:GNAT superfamily N-acetyltransferase
MIRQAQLDDAAALTELLISLGWFQHYFGSASNQVIQSRVSRHLQLCLASNSHSVYIAENPTSDIVGYVTVHWLPYLFLPGPEGFISELFIRESARGQGIGTQLLEMVKKEAIERGCVRLSLINIRSRESYQRGFYSQRGWEERPEAANFILRLP